MQTWRIACPPLPGGATWQDELDWEVGAMTIGNRMKEAWVPDPRVALKTLLGFEDGWSSKVHAGQGLTPIVF